ncbi:MAG: GNAT family N-acetyltransferase, partial [Butyricicoccaceae bacterium]
GPLAVLPACQGKGVGQALIARGKAAARAMGYDAIVIFGDPDYYRRAGFIPGEMYGITDSRGLYAAALLACELVPGALDGCGGRFVRDPVFETDPAEAAAFDRRFPPRAAHAGLPSQRRFEMLASMKRPRP